MNRATWEGLPDGVLELACHAAVPVAIDPGLLHLVRVNFLLDPPFVLSYEAEADLLLSPLVRELGDGLYEIDPRLRRLLLQGLAARFGPDRPRRVATLLERYTLAHRAWREQPELQYAQRLTALNLLDPPSAARWLQQAGGAVRPEPESLDDAWFVAVRRSIRDHRPPRPGQFPALVSELNRRDPDARTAAVHRLGELALSDDNQRGNVTRTLARTAAEDPSTVVRQTALTVLAMVDRFTQPDPVAPGEPGFDNPAWVRTQILDIWRALLRTSYADGKWRWGGRTTPDSASEAEQLLCLLLPGQRDSTLSVAEPNQTAADVADALSALGDAIEIPRRLLQILRDHHERYVDAAGTPIFSGADHPELVTAMALGVRLALATIDFVRVMLPQFTRMDIRLEAEELERRAHERLTAALVGLLRSFAVEVFDPASQPGVNLLRHLGQGEPIADIASRLTGELRSVAAGLRNLTMGRTASELDEDGHRLFACGWSWGIVHSAPMIDFAGIVQAEGVAADAPDLVSTQAALGAIRELSSDRVRVLGVLYEEEDGLVRSLQQRADLTVSYWRTLATFGRGPWPLERVPWAGDVEGHAVYDSLLIASIVQGALFNLRASDADLARVAAVLGEVGTQGRVTRRVLAGEPQNAWHVFGVIVDLVQMSGVPLVSRVQADLPFLLLRSLAEQAGGRRRLGPEARSLLDSVWRHADLRRLAAGNLGEGLWDDPSRVTAETTPSVTGPDWHDTFLVVESLAELCEWRQAWAG